MDVKENLLKINKELLELLQSNNSNSEAYFDILFEEFSQQVNSLVKAGYSDEDISNILKENALQASTELVSKIYEFYQKFLIKNKKNKMSPN